LAVQVLLEVLRAVRVSVVHLLVLLEVLLLSGRLPCLFPS
jgi:hypothetical protein